MSDLPALFDDGADDPRSGPPLTVLTAVAAPSVEAELVAGFADPGLGILVVRRCVDLVELLAAAGVGTARAALVSADLRGLDREALVHLATSGIAVVGLAADEDAERLLHQLGAALVVPAGAPPAQVAGALRAAAAAGPQLASGAPAVRGALPLPSTDQPTGPGTVLAVWGPAGAPGRTTIALGLADAFASRRSLDAARRCRPVRRLRGDPDRPARRGAWAGRGLPRSQCGPARRRPARRVLPHGRHRPARPHRSERPAALDRAAGVRPRSGALARLAGSPTSR